VPAPVSVEVKPLPEQQPAEVKSEVTQPQVQPAVTAEQKPPTPIENAVPVPAPVSAEVKPQPEQQPAEVKPEVTQPQFQPAVTAEQKPPTPIENVVPVPAPVSAEVKPQPEQQPAEVKPEVTKPEVQPVITAEQKPSTQAENVVPVPAPITTEVKPQQAIEKEQNVVTAENAVPKIIVSGCIKDGTTHEAIPAATIFFLDENSRKVFVHKANSTGCFISEVFNGITYRVKAMQTGYSSDCIPFSSGISGKQAEAGNLSDLMLEKPGVIHTYRIENIYYDFDRYFIRPDAEPTLNKLIRVMKEIPATVELGSHADCRGSAAYNMILTERRATSAVQYIVQRGIDESRITSHWYGKSQLTNNCNCAEGVHCTEAQHQANRRTEFTISVPTEMTKETSIDLEQYRDGDTLDLRLLPTGFFENCNHHLISGPLAELLNSSTILPLGQNLPVFYTVQIGAFSFLTPNFNNLNNVMSCKGPDGILRCFVGKFTSRREAIWYRDHLRAREFKDAFVTEMDEKHKPSEPKEIVYLSQK
jgi:outer membrane protein OmpA-like peptidoglycan-associated protein